jgi:hypothetical protein
MNFIQSTYRPCYCLVGGDALKEEEEEEDK